MNDNGVVNQVITDHLPTPLRYGVLRCTPRSSVVAVTDASGSLLEESRYMPFGSVRSDVGAITQTDKTFMKSPSPYWTSGTGQKALADTGLMDYIARMYSSELGRFTQPPERYFRGQAGTIIPGVGNPQAWNSNYIGRDLSARNCTPTTLG